MKVINSTAPKLVQLADLKCGDLFIKDGILHLVIGFEGIDVKTLMFVKEGLIREDYNKNSCKAYQCELLSVEFRQI